MPNPRTPTRLKVIRGTARRDRANPAEPQPVLVPENARPPEWLELSPLARRAWRDLVRHLRSMAVMTNPDRIAVALLADALASYVEAKATVVKEGSTYETVGEKGGMMIRKHPAVEIGAEASRFAKIMLGEFGLTPASRSKVSHIEGGAKDPTQAWLEGSGS